MAPSAATPQVVLAQPRRQQQSKPEPKPQELIDIRTMSPADRHALAWGGCVKIYRGRGMHDYIGDIPVRLVQRASVIANKLLAKISAGIHLPHDTDKQGIIDFLQYLVYLTKAEEQPAPMTAKEDTRRDLCICGGAYLLGMLKYASHIYDYYWAYWTETIPNYDEVTLISNLPASIDRNGKLFNKMARDLAGLVRSNTVPDPEHFTAYLDTHNNRLRDTIININNTYAYRARKEAERAEWQRKAKEAGRLQKEFEEKRAKKEEEDRIKEKEKFEAMKTRNAALERAIREKMKKGGQMFTTEEKQHWVRTRGTRPPKGR